ncbi:SPOR domain-containing protein [Pedobacter sp. ASV1-7]|uniref:HU domain-containing protein n=1 Tax=Pedobacter sp. ASV1-7 TaxID=3145237 RepID=UPI0032E87D0A
MDILSYLTTLIKTHKEVGIPGLGTIYKKKSPGRYDINTHSFLPPSYILSFTSDLKEQSLLSEFISKNKNISIDASTYFVEQFSQNILDELSGHQESDFGDLGTFSTASGSLTFIPKQDSNLGFDFYGLPQLKAEPDTDKVKVLEEPVQEEAEVVKSEELEVVEEVPERTETPETVEVPIEEGSHVTEEQLELENNNADLSDGTEDLNANDEQPVYEEITEVGLPPITTAPSLPVVEKTENIVEDVIESPIAQPVEDIDKPEEVHFSLDYTSSEKTGMPSYLKVILALVILAVLAAVLYLAKPDIFDSLFKKSTATQQPVIVPDSKPVIENVEQARLDSIAQADSLRISNEKAILAADSARDSMANVKPATVVTTEPTFTYEIIAASLRDQKEGDKFLADMKARGIPAKVADMPGRRVKITIGSFTNEEAAKKELEVLKKTTRIPGIYVIKVRHTNNPK